jgi:RNA polymerase sigma-I factor
LSSSNFFSRDKLSKDNLKSFIEGLRLDDNESRNTFIDENKSFILKVVSKALNRSTIPHNSKEFEIGLSSFDYAIDTYDLNSDDDFLSYAEKVIKNSVYDYIKLTNANSTTFTTQIENEYLYRDYENKDEISKFKLKLWELDITLDSLVNVTPSDEESVKTSITTARKLLYNPEVFRKISAKAGIPYDMLDRDLRNNKKFIERHKAYIIALALIINSNLAIFKSYLKNMESGNKSPDNVGIILELYKEKALFFTLQGKFTIAKIKNNPNLYIGRQMVMSSEYIKKTTDITKYSVFAASFFVITLTLLVGFTYLIRSDTASVYSPSKVGFKNADLKKENIEKKPSVPVFTAVSTKVLNPTPEANIKSTDFIPATPTPVQPTNTAAKPKTTKKPKDTKKPPEPTPPTDKAVGPPDTPVINCDTDTVSSGDTYNITMNMAGGNNGTIVVLYENDKIVLFKRYKDSSPDPQTESMSFKAKSTGTFKYRFKLINSKGSAVSETISVNVQ